jgi:hypothetical protein
MKRTIQLVAAVTALAVIMGAGCIEYGGPGAVKKMPQALTFMISSETTSDFTPCGCHSGKWGGMPRRGTIFKEVEEKVDWPVLLVDTGNVTQGSKSDMQKLKDMYIMQSYDFLQYDFVSVGCNELRLGPEDLMKTVEEHTIPWSSCNVYAEGVYPELQLQPPAGSTIPGARGTESGTQSPGASPTNPASADTDAERSPTPSAATGTVPSDEPLFPTYRVVVPDGAPGYKIGFVGAVIQDPGRLNTVDGFSFRPYGEAIREQVDALRSKEKVDLVILLCDADDISKAQNDGTFDGIDIVIGGNLRPPTSPNARINPLNPMYSEAAVRQQLQQASKDKKEPLTPEGDEEVKPTEGQGEEIETPPALELKPLPLPLIIKKGAGRGRLVNRLDITLDSTGRIVDFYFEEIRVDDTHPDDPRLAEIAQGYDREVLAVELMDRIERTYAGSAACESCHPGFLARWSDHGHFHAYATIEEGGKLDDPECTRCHASGFTEEPRLLTYDLISEPYRNVGCEGCHPNGQRHITLQNHLAGLSPENRANVTTTDPISIGITGSTCTRCHTGEWGVGFEPNAAIEAARKICRSAAQSGG